MTESGKIRPTINGKGITIPWLGVVVGIFVLFMSGLVPLFFFAIRAHTVASHVEAIQASDKEQDKTLTKHGEDIAALKAKGTP